MNLTQPQKNALKAHLAANTNTTPAVAADGSALPTPFVVNQEYLSGDAEKERAIAEWYNLLAQAGDNQPFATREFWNPNCPATALQRVVDWTVNPPHGLGGSPTVTEQHMAINNKWWRWDQMLRVGYLDMTDAQVRAAVLNIWGNAGSGTAANIGNPANEAGKLAGLRVELAIVPIGTAAMGAASPAWTAAMNPRTLADGSKAVGGQKISQPELHDAIVNGVAT